MREFIEALFEKKDKIEFQYEDYEMSFYAGRFKSYYLIFYIRAQEELMELWKNTSSIFKAIKQNEDIYNNNMDKNIVCVYCLNVSEEEYYETGKTGTISGLSKKISSIEEDLNFFIKHVFLYTDKMKNVADKYIGEFNTLCKKYLTIENFEQYKNEIEESYVYDFLMNLFIKFPFLKIGEYMNQNQEGQEYRAATSFIEEKIKKDKIDLEKMREIMDSLEEIKDWDTDDVIFKWIVDLLRYEFEDRQIFISTHEQTFEWFLRYRYSKANKAVKIFNMKEIMLKEAGE